MSEVLYRRGLPVDFTAHALESMRKRGAKQSEIEQVIRTAEWERARQERFEAKLDFPYNDRWNGEYYQIKQVNPVFVIENNKIIVITVYVFYF